MVEGIYLRGITLPAWRSGENSVLLTLGSPVFFCDGNVSDISPTTVVQEEARKYNPSNITVFVTVRNEAMLIFADRLVVFPITDLCLVP